MNNHLAPWSISADNYPADSYASDQLEFLLQYALLAPSPHNTQPWLFRINTTDAELYLDRRRLLPVVDPEAREMVLSCGAALSNLRIATEYFSHSFQVEILPDPANPQFIARFHLGLQGETTGEDITLFHAITQRHTNRLPFEDKPIPTNLLEEWTALAGELGCWFLPYQDDTSRQTLAALVAEGDQRQWSDKPFRAELAQWIRTKPAEHGDGLSPSVAGVGERMSFASSFLVRNFNRGEGQAATDREVVLHSPVLAVLGTASDDLPAWINAGQALQRILLAARSEDIWSSFLNQPVEIPDLRLRLSEAIGASGFPQVLLRLGYGPEAPPAPRRSLRQMLLMHKPSHPTT
jgi:nitroreductase